jgi:hypothetical protein
VSAILESIAFVAARFATTIVCRFAVHRARQRFDLVGEVTVVSASLLSLLAPRHARTRAS